MNCPECKQELPDGANYCFKCGPVLKKKIHPPKEWSDNDPFDKEVIVTGTKEAEPSTEYFKAGSIFANQFEILSNGLQGGMGVVYKCKNTKLDKTIALKVIHPKLLESEQAMKRFRQEVAISQDLRDPQNIIITVYDIGEWEGKEYFTMEWIEGVTLREIIAERKKEERPFSAEEASIIISQLSEALQYAHNHKDKILHRDIKPENIMVTDKAALSIKLTDFGIAKMLNPSGFQYVSGKQTGTPYYMAPEQKNFTDNIDKRVDIYSVGVVLFELLTLENSIGYELPSQLNKELPKEIDEIHKRAVARNPEARYGDIEELSKELHKVVSKEKVKREEQERAETERRQEIDLRLNEGKAFLENNDFDRAIEAFETLLKTEPEHQKGKELLAKAQEQKKREEERRRTEAVRQERIDSLLKKGKAYLEKNDYARAIEMFENILELESEHREGKELLAKAYDQKKEAEERKRKEAEKQQKIASILKGGRNCLEEGKLNEAIEAFETLLKIDSGHKEGKELLLKAREEQKRAEEEARESEKRREVNSLLDKGKRCIEEKDFGQAIEIFENLIKIDAEHEEGRSLLTLAREGKKEEEARIREKEEEQNNDEAVETAKKIERTTEGTESPEKFSRLSPWNPIDHMRFLWWIFVAPRKQKAYLEQFGDNEYDKSTTWFRNTLLWLSPFLISFALGSGEIPINEKHQYFYIWISRGVILFWILTGILAYKNVIDIGAESKLFFCLIALIFVLMILFVKSIGSIILGELNTTFGGWLFVGLLQGFVFILFYGTTHVVISAKLDDDLDISSPRFKIIRIIVFFIMLSTTYSILVWYLFFDGWLFIHTPPDT